MAEEGDDLSGASEFAAKAEAESPAEQSRPKEEPKQEGPVEKEVSKPSAPMRSSPGQEELKSGDVIFATPIAKKIALERGIPLSKVKGTGPDGRIIRADVEAYKGGSGAASVTSASTIGGSSEAAAASFTDLPLTNMRKTIGTRLTESKTSIPHYYVTVDIDMGRTLKLREVFNKQLSEKEESKARLSVNDFIVKASALALRDVPEANSAWLGDQIRQCVNVFTLLSPVSP